MQASATLVQEQMNKLTLESFFFVAMKKNKNQKKFVLKKSSIDPQIVFEIRNYPMDFARPIHDKSRL